MHRKIILASKSKARQNLLKQIGLKFQVAESSIKETRKPPHQNLWCGGKLKKGCSDLVIENALLKAKDISKKFSSGIVIGADTVVFAGGKITGKPKDTKHAFRILNALSKKPQWIYTGIAVIDIDKKKILTDYEKTKIYMYPLTAKQIKKYIKKVYPLDKAGSFDIQGLGSIFINRIEGCYYNVVGLPLAKLARLLHHIGYDIF